MAITKIDEGFIIRQKGDEPKPVVVGPRCTAARNGDLICSANFQSQIGINDFEVNLSRSSDGGQTWSQAQPVWPDLRENFGLYASISSSPTGELYLYGLYMPIDTPGEPFWSEQTQGMKQNDIFWGKSEDDGRTWSEPTVISKPTIGSAEAPGAMCITRTGRWLACYAPYRTFDPSVLVDRSHIVVLISDDQGKTWSARSMLRFEEADSSGCEAWVIELTDGRLLGACYHVNDGKGKDYPNVYAVSLDGGQTWEATHSTGIMGQSSALAALPGGRCLFVYNQRTHGQPGVWLAVAAPSVSDFGLESDEIVWQAETATQHGSSGDFSQWTDFSFGEPSVTVLPDKTLLVTLWCIQPSGQGIRYVRLETDLL